MHHELNHAALSNPGLRFLAEHLHQIDLAVIVAAFLYYLCRFRNEMFGIFRKSK